MNTPTGLDEGLDAVRVFLGPDGADVTTTGWDINPRVLGTVPAEAKVSTIEGFHWVADAHYMIVPKGVSDDKLAVLLDVPLNVTPGIPTALTFGATDASAADTAAGFTYTVDWGDGTLPQSVTSAPRIANSPAEQELIAALVAPGLGLPPAQVPAWSSLLLGPLFRGTEATVQ